MENQEEEIDYDSDEAAEYILENISDELCEKLSHQDIVTLLNLENEYVENEEKKYEKRIRESGINILLSIDQEKVNDYIEINAWKYKINLDIDEVEEIMYAHIDYLEATGLTEEGISIYYN
jgi:hypothetical protein